MKKLVVPIFILHSLQSMAAMNCDVSFVNPPKQTASKLEFKKTEISKTGVTGYAAEKDGFDFEIVTYHHSDEIQKLVITEKASHRSAHASYEGMTLKDPNALFMAALANESEKGATSVILRCKVKQ